MTTAMIQPRHLFADFEMSKMDIDDMTLSHERKSIRKVLSEDYWESLSLVEKQEFEQMAKEINKIQPRLMYVSKRLSDFASNPEQSCSRRELAKLKKCFSDEFRALPVEEKMHFIQLSNEERKKVCPWYNSKAI
jgi:hypothetical protein